MALAGNPDRQAVTCPEVYRMDTGRMEDQLSRIIELLEEMNRHLDHIEDKLTLIWMDQDDTDD